MLYTFCGSLPSLHCHQPVAVCPFLPLPPGLSLQFQIEVKICSTCDLGAKRLGHTHTHRTLPRGSACPQLLLNSVAAPIRPRRRASALSLSGEDVNIHVRPGLYTDLIGALLLPPQPAFPKDPTQTQTKMKYQHRQIIPALSSPTTPRQSQGWTDVPFPHQHVQTFKNTAIKTPQSSSFAHPTQPQSQIKHQHRLKKLHNTQPDSETQPQRHRSTTAATIQVSMSKPFRDLPSNIC